jgi:hypothetical protein
MTHDDGYTTRSDMNAVLGRQRVTAGALAGLLALGGCQDRLTAPVTCPQLCPGSLEVRDTVLDAVPQADSSYEGYFGAGQGSSLRVSYQLPASEDRAVIRFVARPDSFPFAGDSVVPYTLDSLELQLSLLYRDSTVKDLRIYLYRLPPRIDSTITFVDADTAFTPANIIDSILVDDSVVTRRFIVKFQGADTTRLSIPAADSGIVSMGVQMRAAQGTGIRIGGPTSGASAPSFINYVTIPLTDTTTAQRIWPRSVFFGTFRSQTVPALDLSVLTVGGVPSARSLIRFPWPAYLKDSAQLLRATLELIPTAPIPGLPGDTAQLQARAVLVDLGSKSPAITDFNYIAVRPVPAGDGDTVSFEVRRAVSLWQGTNPLPPAFVLQLLPEASSFTRATFGSTRAGQVPRLRLTYALKFPFEAP